MPSTGNTCRIRTSGGCISGGQRAYAWAKACGIIGKSFTGKRVSAIAGINRLSELDRLVFPGASRDLPEKELMKDIEKRIINRAADAIRVVVDSFDPVPEFLVLLIRGWEYENLKNALTALEGGTGGRPSFVDLKNFATINFSAWPDIKAMLSLTEFEYLLKLKDKDSFHLQTELDRHYYSSLWKALCRLGRNDRLVSEKILGEEISLRNFVCALRLRTYYQMNRNEIIPHLVDIKTVKNRKTVSLAADAIASLDFPLDERQAWMSCGRARFLNSETSAGVWMADPRFVQNASARYLYRMARKSFRTRPFSLDSIFCFIKIKQFEEDVLTSFAEGLGMGMNAGDVFSMFGVEPQ